MGKVIITVVGLICVLAEREGRAATPNWSAAEVAPADPPKKIIIRQYRSLIPRVLL